MKKKRLKHAIIPCTFAFFLSPMVIGSDGGASAFDRTKLPIAGPNQPDSTILNIHNAKPPPRFDVEAPKGAPNVLIILIDDMGFGQPSAFGGPVKMPTAEKLLSNGIHYNQFHTTALSSPTRAALLTGRNHHMCNTGSVMEIATDFPGQTGVRPESIAPLAKILRYNGYSTAQFGKNHETPAWQVSPSGATDLWPTRNGFDKFYGFMGGETNQWSPSIYEDMTAIDVPQNPNYHFMTDMADHAISWVQSQKSLTPDKPFFIYFAPGATHAPHHVPKEWIAKYKGKFDQGWDKLREQTLERQKKLGVVPPDTKLAPKPKGIKDWDELTANERKLFSHQMEIFAGFGEYADYEIGRLVKAVSNMGQLDNTLIFYILGDNGASAEGGMSGLFNENTYFNGVKESVEQVLQHYDELGGPKSYPHYAIGWAVAGDTPFTWTKQVASSYGGTRNGLVIHWPKGVKSKGELRTQWFHVIDVVPTILNAANLPQPQEVNGVVQTPIEGVSMLPTFNDAFAPELHKTQYFEIFGNRAIYHDGWLAGAIHLLPWDLKPPTTFENDKWELYDTRNDFSLVNDLSEKDPEKLKEMQDLFMKEAIKNHVLPLDDRVLERLSPIVAGRPYLMAGRHSLTVYQGMTGMLENVFIDVKNRSHSITADLDIPQQGANGVILAQAGRFGGYSFYLKDGRPTYTYNWLGLKSYTVGSSAALPAGKVTVSFKFDYDGGGQGKGGKGSILVNGGKVAEGRIDQTEPNMFSAEEGADVGEDGATPVVEEYGITPPYKFTGKIERVVIDVKEMDDHVAKLYLKGLKEAYKKVFDSRE